MDRNKKNKKNKNLANSEVEKKLKVHKNISIKKLNFQFFFKISQKKHK